MLKFLTAVSVLLLWQQSSFSQPLSITALSQNSTSKYLNNPNAVEQGFCGDVYTRLAKRLIKYDIYLGIERKGLPIKRILHRMKSEPAIFCGAGRNAEREAKYAYATQPIYYTANIVVAHQEDTYNPTSIDDLVEMGEPVGAFYGTTSSKFLLKHPGVRVADHYYDLDVGLKDVEKGNLRYFYYHDLGLLYMLRDGNYKLRVVPTHFRRVPQWVLMSREIPEMTKQLIDKELNEMLATGEVDAIWNRYTPQLPR